MTAPSLVGRGGGAAAGRQPRRQVHAQLPSPGGAAIGAGRVIWPWPARDP